MLLTRTTLNRQAYQALRGEILGRRLPPGHKLVVRVLAAELGLSPTPVKEALSALEREGLVVAVPHRGYYVLDPSPSDIREIYSLREVLEGLAARLAVEQGGPDLATRLEQVFIAQQQAAEAHDLSVYGDLDLEFHRILWEASGNQRLLAVSETIDGQIRLLINSSATIPGRLAGARAEHRAVLLAAQAGLPQQAEEAMRQHVRNAGAALAQHLANR